MAKKQLYKIITILGLVLIGLELASIIFALAYSFLINIKITRQNADFYKKLAEKYQISLNIKTQENLNLQETINQQEAAVSNVQSQLNSLAQNVNTLVKLRNLDEELLKKYSKIYFLNENYAPRSLLKIDSQYVSNSKDQYILSNVLPFLYTLLQAVQKDNVDLKIRWAYRSFWEQYNLKSRDVMVYGSGANKFTADQGYSEHQLGTTVDFATAENDYNTTGFSKTKAYQWLLDNAYKYGFILSYPKNNAYYIFEPWHWRFVGVKLATKLHNENKHFYDLDQREIDEYLLYIFDW